MSRFKTRRSVLAFGIVLALSIWGLAIRSGGVQPALASTLTVNSLADTVGACPSASACTLRQAIGQAASGDTITFSVSGTITITATLPAIGNTLTIDGTGQSVSIDGNHFHIFTVNSGGALSLNALTVSRGGTGLAGGAILNDGTVNITNSTFANNSAVAGVGSGGGGAIENRNAFATLNVINSTFSGNSAAIGGAIDNPNTGTVNIANSTFASNSANSGGAVANSGGYVTITNSTFVGNTGPASGGTLLNGGLAMTLNNNILTLSTMDGICANTGSLFTGANNLSDDVTCPGSIGQVTNLSNTLVSNGGPTQTLALLAGSNAIDGVPGGSCVYASLGQNPLFANGAPITTDQRGVTRPQGILCDIGAYELLYVRPTDTPTSTPSRTPTSTNTPTHTATHTPTSTPTHTATPSNTPTSTPTNRPVLGRLDTIGVFRSGTFLLRLHNATGFADISVAFNPGTNPYPIVGDWTGAGYDTVGAFDQNSGSFSLCTANDTTTCRTASNTFQFVFGRPNDLPLAGKWTIGFNHFGGGVFRPSDGLIYLKNDLTTGFADYTMILGVPGDIGLAGDWNGDGLDSPGVYRPSLQKFFLNDQVCNCSEFATYTLQYGVAGDYPVNGDWVGQGHDGIGLFRQGNGFTYLRNALTTGFADITFTYGIAGDVPVAGHWQLTYPPAPQPANVFVSPTSAPQSGAGTLDDGGLRD